MTAFFIAFRALVRKDLILFLSDRRALLVNLALPILIATFFGYLFGYQALTSTASLRGYAQQIRGATRRWK